MTAVIRLQQGDITTARVEAIVNAANSALLGGGGVDGAIHAAAGPGLLAACRRLPELRPGVRCPTGEARATAGFGLAAQHVIHTVGPVYASAGAGAPGQLAACHRNSLTLCRQLGARSVAFPAISCGVYGYPLQEAARVAVETCLAEADQLAVYFWLFSPECMAAWRQALDGIG